MNSPFIVSLILFPQQQSTTQYIGFDRVSPLSLVFFFIFFSWLEMGWLVVVAVVCVCVARLIEFAAAKVKPQPLVIAHEAHTGGYCTIYTYIYRAFALHAEREWVSEGKESRKGWPCVEWNRVKAYRRRGKIQALIKILFPLRRASASLSI